MERMAGKKELWHVLVCSREAYCLHCLSLMPFLGRNELDIYRKRAKLMAGPGRSLKLLISVVFEHYFPIEKNLFQIMRLACQLALFVTYQLRLTCRQNPLQAVICANRC